MKKKMIVIVAVLAMILCFAGCGKNYDDVKTALANNTWYFNGGDTALNSITFGEEEATISQVSFDGNGKQNSPLTNTKGILHTVTVSHTDTAVNAN